MIAFEIFGWPVYWYGIFYGVTFLFGYRFFGWVADKSWMKNYPQVKKILTQKKDDLFLVCMLGVIIGGRLGHVFIYEWSYYSQHLLEIIQINQGGMSFIGGVIGVTVGLAYLIRKRNLSFESMKLLGDLVLCVVPVGIFLGRIGNGLNQELRGKPITQIEQPLASILQTIGLTRTYPAVDALVRVDTNMIQAALEGFMPGIFIWLLLQYVYPKRKHSAGLISGVFLVLYGVMRYRVEPLKDLPVNEIVGPLSISQWIMILFICIGGYLIAHNHNKSISSANTDPEYS